MLFYVTLSIPAYLACIALFILWCHLIKRRRQAAELSSALSASPSVYIIPVYELDPDLNEEFLPSSDSDSPPPYMTLPPSYSDLPPSDPPPYSDHQ